MYPNYCTFTLTGLSEFLKVTVNQLLPSATGTFDNAGNKLQWRIQEFGMGRQTFHL